MQSSFWMMFCSAASVCSLNLNGPCPHINTDTRITGPNNVPCYINGSFTCNSTDVVYAITCQHCPSAVYIGQTGQSLRQRMNSHKFDIRNNDPQKPVSMHFNQPGHSLQHFKVAVLWQGPFKSRLQREAVEQNIIQKLDCIKHGLNRDSGFFLTTRTNPMSHLRPLFVGYCRQYFNFTLSCPPSLHLMK